MLDQLSVKNFVVVEDLNIEFLHGMTVVTGETGAGKSIIVQALNLAIGGRSDAALVRNGKSKAEIIATFSFDGNQSIQSVLEGLDLEDGNECILRRVIGSDGKSRSYVNGSNVTLSSTKIMVLVQTSFNFFSCQAAFSLRNLGTASPRTSS